MKRKKSTEQTDWGAGINSSDAKVMVKSYTFSKRFKPLIVQ